MRLKSSTNFVYFLWYKIEVGWIVNFLLADDHAIVREGMASALRDFDANATVFEAQDVRGVLDAINGNVHLDMILMDLFMPGGDGFYLLIKVRELRPDVPLVVLSASEEVSHIQKALECGASGFIPKSMERDVILSAIGLVLSGGVFVPPQLINRTEHSLDKLAETASESTRSTLPERPETSLTKRQIEVLQLMGEGKSNKEIARQLNLSDNTVKIHVTAILRSFRVTNRTKAVLAARQLGLLPGD